MLEDQMVDHLKADAAVSALVAGRIHPGIAPQGTPSPFLTYSIAGITDRPGIAWATGKAVFDVTSVQIDCWSDEATDQRSRYRQVLEVARAVRAALDQVTLNGEDDAAFRFENWLDLNTTGEARRTVEFAVDVLDP